MIWLNNLKENIHKIGYLESNINKKCIKQIFKIDNIRWFFCLFNQSFTFQAPPPSSGAYTEI